MVIVPECGDYYEIVILYIVKKEHLAYFYLLSSSFNKRKGILSRKRQKGHNIRIKEFYKWIKLIL